MPSCRDPHFSPFLASQGGPLARPPLAIPPGTRLRGPAGSLRCSVWRGPAELVATLLKQAAVLLPETLKTTGKAVTFTGFTLAIGVATWIFSAIKFQADMGILLTFMFLWNMFGALWLLPALARFLIRPEKLRS